MFSVESISGKCGYNLIYILYDTGLLNIYGTGSMYAYYYDFNNYFIQSTSHPWSNSSVSSVVIEDGVTNIGMFAFYNCSNLTSITIPDSVTSIDACAFYGCSNLTSITISDNVTMIGTMAFYNCPNLKIYCKSNSYAETYALENNIRFVEE